MKAESWFLEPDADWAIEEKLQPIRQQFISLAETVMELPGDDRMQAVSYLRAAWLWARAAAYQQEVGHE